MPATDSEILDMLDSGHGTREICRELKCGDKRVKRMKRLAVPSSNARMPDPAPESGGPIMPDSLDDYVPPLQINEPGHWLVLGDVHIPHHDKTTCELAIAEAKRCNARGVILNGDVMDSGELSDHKKHKSPPRYRDDIGTGNQFLRYLRSKLPNASIKYRRGNHELRLDAYVVKNAPALEGMPGVDLKSFLTLNNCGVEWVENNVVRLGKLNIIHGHEYKGGGGENPAKWLRMKANDVAMCGHFHRTDQHGARRITDYQEVCWTVGCACHLHPEWLPLNNWNHGFAMVELASDGNFKVRNMRVLNGEVV